MTAARLRVRTSRRATRSPAAGTLTLALTVALAAAPFLLAATAASAHTAVESGDPALGATSAGPPPQLTLTFEESLGLVPPVVTVTGPDRKAYAAGAPTATGHVLTQRLVTSGPAGRYAVAYRVVAADGHPVSGTWGYSVRAAAHRAAAQPATASTASAAVTADARPVGARTAATSDTNAAAGDVERSATASAPGGRRGAEAAWSTPVPSEPVSDGRSLLVGAAALLLALGGGLAMLRNRRPAGPGDDDLAAMSGRRPPGDHHCAPNRDRHSTAQCRDLPGATVLAAAHRPAGRTRG